MNSSVLKFIASIMRINLMGIPEREKDRLKRQIVEDKLNEVCHIRDSAKQ